MLYYEGGLLIVTDFGNGLDYGMLLVSNGEQCL